MRASTPWSAAWSGRLPASTVTLPRRPGVQLGKCLEQPFAEEATDADLVPGCLRLLVHGGENRGTGG